MGRVTGVPRGPEEERRAFKAKCLATGPARVGDEWGRADRAVRQWGSLAGQGSMAPTSRRGKLQGRLRVAVLTAIHC